MRKIAHILTAAAAKCLQICENMQMETGEPLNDGHGRAAIERLTRFE